jgi:uncharacterized protein YktA (UPF0223 family)
MVMKIKINTPEAKSLRTWKRIGLVLSSKEEGSEIYDRYINSTNCEKCGNKYKSTKDRCMDHIHLIDDKYGYFRNVLCKSCNEKRIDRNQKNNTSGYNGISKLKKKNCTQGFMWRFRVHIDGKETQIKTSVDYDKLVEFAKKWKLDNNY